VYADQGFSGRLVEWTRDTLTTTPELVRKPADQQGFAGHPRRWMSGWTTDAPHVHIGSPESAFWQVNNGLARRGRGVPVD
jgi:hypothetical protein